MRRLHRKRRSNSMSAGNFGQRVWVPLGTRFGALVVVANDIQIVVPSSKGVSKNTTTTFGCVLLCDCGNTRIVHNGGLRLKDTARLPKYCCPQCPLQQGNLKEGHTRIPYYYVYASMLQRCYNPKHTSYQDYGGRGIKVCNEWLTRPMAFFEHIGPRPPNPEGWCSARACYSLDRIDSNGDYRPGNVRWATNEMQNANRERRS